MGSYLPYVTLPIAINNPPPLNKELKFRYAAHRCYCTLLKQPPPLLYLIMRSGAWRAAYLPF